MYLKRGANQRLSSLLRLLLRLLPQNFYMAPYLERGQEESSPIGINGHSTLERKATKPFSKSTFWPYVCVCAWKHLPVMLGQIGELVKVVSDSPSSILVTMTAPRGELPHCDAGGRFGHLILISLYKYVHRRHCNPGHRAMGRVVFLPRPEIRGTFLLSLLII